MLLTVGSPAHVPLAELKESDNSSSAKIARTGVVTPFLIPDFSFQIEKGKCVGSGNLVAVKHATGGTHFAITGTLYYGFRYYPPGTGTATHYVIDDLNPTGYSQVLVEYNNPQDAPVRYYVYGLDLISQNRNAGTVLAPVYATDYYGYDGHGSVRFLLDSATGNTTSETDTYDYDAFGNLIAQSGSTDNNILYAGEYWDKDLNLYYLRARHYDPGLGRFTTMDTYEGASSDPLSLHKYLYCHADPLNNIDPSGHESLSSMVTSMGIRMHVAATHIGSVAARAAPYLKNYFTSTKMAQRAAMGTLIAGGINNYADFYIPPTVDELVLLSNEMIPLKNLPDGRNPSAEVMKLATLGTQLNEELAAGNVSGPLRAQLPPYNWFRSGMMGYEALSYIAHVEESVATIGQSFGLNVKLDVNLLQVGSMAIFRRLDPDGDVRTAREAVAAYNQRDMATLATKIAELQKRLSLYGTVTVQR